MKPDSLLCTLLGGGWILGSQPGTLLGGCSLPSLSLSLEPLDFLSHLSGYLQAGQWRRLEGLPGVGCCCPHNSSGSVFLARQPSSLKQAEGFHLLLW